MLSEVVSEALSRVATIANLAPEIGTVVIGSGKQRTYYSMGDDNDETKS